MSAFVVTTQLTNPDPNQTNPANMQELVNDLNPLLVSAIQGDYVPYVKSSSTPSPSDNEKIWFQLDQSGQPVSINILYQASWRRFFTGLPNEIRMFTGDPGVYFDSSGKGLISPTNNDPNTWDGWAICNGQNGTTNLSDKFVIGGRMDNQTVSGFSTTAKNTQDNTVYSGWQTNVTGAALGVAGAAAYTIQNNNLPNMTVTITGAPGYRDDITGAPLAPLVTTKNYGNIDQKKQLASFGADPGATPPVAQVDIPTIPPFYALAYCQWIKY